VHKRILSTILAASIVFTVGSSALAAPTQSQLSQSKSNLEQAKQKVASLEDQVMKIDGEIETISKEKADIDNKISKVQNSIKLIKKDIKASQDKINDEQALYNQRIRTMYMNGNNQSYVNIVLGSKSFSDLISNIETVQKIADYDKNLIANLNSQKDQVEKEKDRLSSVNSNLLSLQSEKVKKINDDNDKKAKAVALASQATSEMQKNKAYYDQLQAQSKAAAATLIAANTTTTTTTAQDRGGHVTPVPSSINASGVVGIAVKYLGVNYVYGGASPSGFDCSGLVMYCYAQMGVSLPHYTGDQVKYGTTVTDLQPGDLLFFGSTSAPNHVAIYAGNGQMIEAPHTGAQVRVTPVRSYSIAKRL
jgi:cell wall-associated NlpC family hydrolase